MQVIEIDRLQDDAKCEEMDVIDNAMRIEEDALEEDD
jgi:hypothetical protein